MEIQFMAKFVSETWGWYVINSQINIPRYILTSPTYMELDKQNNVVFDSF